MSEFTEMNILLLFGLMILTGYLTGLLLEKAGMPKIIGYILTGVVLSPGLTGFTDEGFMESMKPVMDISLAFIAFEVGGELKWVKIRQHKKEILSITFLSGVIPFLLIPAGIYILYLLIPGAVPSSPGNTLLFALILGALAGPTAPATSFAVIHQYKARGRVTETMIEVVALLDVLGILLFSLTIAVLPLFLPTAAESSAGSSLPASFYKLGISIVAGAALGYLFTLSDKLLKIVREGQWVIIIFSLVVLGLGISSLLDGEELLVSMSMGLVVTNTCPQQEKIFRILHRYTESLVFLIFFLLSGLHLDVAVITKAIPMVIVFVVLRAAGKYLGVLTGAQLVHAEKKIRKYTAGGLIPQAGITIGLVLSIHQNELFGDISEMLLATIMGATIINEIAGPFATRWSLKQAGETQPHKEDELPESKGGERRNPPNRSNRKSSNNSGGKS